METTDMSRPTAVIPMPSLPRPINLGDRIYADLLSRLQHGTIASSERLVDVDLARTYGTSRMPVRDALLRLTNEGYLVGTTRGFAVPQHTDQDIRDIFEVRRQLEPYAAGCAARDLDQQAQRMLTQALKGARAAHTADDPHAMITSNIAFRSAWQSAVSNRRLAETISRFADQVHTVRVTTLADRATRRVVVQGLEGLYDAMVRHDQPLTVKRMSAFIDAAENAFFDRSSAAATEVARAMPATRRRR